MNKLASALTGVNGERVALCDVAVSAVLQDLLAEVSVSQTYRNDERVNIEAVYTFPLPLDAVLLDLEIDIGGRVLKGIVVGKQAAEEQYEEAVEGGDAAVMLEAIEPGLYTMNVGNLLPQESVKITFSYAMLYRWTGDRLRFFLPTTIAPRFGASPHLPHQAPEASLEVENQFSLRVEVFGALRDAQFLCPSHAVELRTSPEKAVLTLQQTKAVMDRDFILNVRAPQATRSFVLSGRDGDGMTAIASFQPFFPGLQQPRPLSLAIVIDCSGSMQGDSIAQAKQALDGILESLQPEDRVTVIAFGNSTKALSKQLLPCNKTNIAKGRRFATSLEADMGGTEIGEALRDAYSTLRGTTSADVFLVTDGEVAEWQPIVDDAKNSGHRIFTVGVGSAVSEAFMRGLAAATGGECELVSPREGMADRVFRHFERMRAPRAKRVAVFWPEGAANVSPTRIGAVFEGDTVIASASFAGAQTDSFAVLEVETDAGDTLRQQLALPSLPAGASTEEYSTVARVAAASRLKEVDAHAGQETAVRYQLISPWTNWLVVAARAESEKAVGIPALRKVPQTIAAGWGGLGVAMPRALYSDAMLANTSRKPALMHARPSDDTCSFLLSPPHRSAKLTDAHKGLLALIHADSSKLSFDGCIDLLIQSGLEKDYEDLFHCAADLGLDVRAIAAMVVSGLLGGSLGERVSGDAAVALASLQEQVEEATMNLRTIGRLGLSLARMLTRDKVTQSLFRPLPDDDTVLRLGKIQGLLNEIDKLASGEPIDLDEVLSRLQL